MADAASVKIPPVKLKPNEIQALCAYSEGKSTSDINKGYRCDMGAYSKSKQITMRLVCTPKKDCTLQLPDGTAFPENLLPTMKSLLIFVVPAAEFTSFCKKRAGTFKDSGSGYLKCDYKTTAGAFTAYRDNDAVVVFGDAGVLTPKAAHDLFNRKL
jgi:hypothetical protein